MRKPAQLTFAREKAKNWLKILDENLIGPNKKFLCGDEVTIADYFGACLLTAGEIVHCDYKPWPNVVPLAGEHAARCPIGVRCTSRSTRSSSDPMKDAPFAMF